MSGLPIGRLGEVAILLLPGLPGALLRLLVLQIVGRIL
jgi:hypothetical protein